jgi:hypothetical protein
MCFGMKPRRKETTGENFGMPFGETKSLAAVDESHAQGFVEPICLHMNDLPHVRADCKVRHASSRLTMSILSAALRSRCKMIIGAELSLYAGVRRSRSKRFQSPGRELVNHECKEHLDERPRTVSIRY